MAKATKTTKKALYGTERDHDLPWNEKKVAVFKALRSPKLQGGKGTAAELVTISGDKITPRDVRHYCYHGKAAGLTTFGEGDGVGYVYGLTAKGRGIDPDKAFKEQQESRKAKKAPKITKAKKAAPKKKAPKKAESTTQPSEATAS